MPYGNPYQEEEHDEVNHGWMITFADLLSLLLSFFVMLFAMSALDIKRWEEITLSFNQKIRIGQISITNQPSEVLSVTKVTERKAADLNYLSSVIYDKFQDTGQLNKLFHMQKLQDRLILSLIGNDVFIKGSDALTDKAYAAFDMIGIVLQSLPNHIDVYGYAPVEGQIGHAFSSHWELSLLRAVRVSKALRKRGYAYKITAFGRANTRDNKQVTTDEENDQAAAERVDIVIRSRVATY